MDGDWWATLEGDLRRHLREHGPLTPPELGRKLGLSPQAVTSLALLLAQEGKVRICLLADGDIADG